MSSVLLTTYVFLCFIAGLIAACVSNPLWVVNTRLKLQGIYIDGHNFSKQQKYPRYHGLIGANYWYSKNNLT